MDKLSKRVAGIGERTGSDRLCGRIRMDEEAECEVDAGWTRVMVEGLW